MNEVSHDSAFSNSTNSCVRGTPGSSMVRPFRDISLEPTVRLHVCTGSAIKSSLVETLVIEKLSIDGGGLVEVMR